MSVPTLVTLTVAPGTAPPLASVTVPEMRPVMVCASAPLLKAPKMMTRSKAAKGVILRFIAFLRCWASCCGRASGSRLSQPDDTPFGIPKHPSKARQSANECQTDYRICILGQYFFQFYKLSRSQNGFGGALLFKLARGVDGHLGAVSRRQCRDPRHGLPAKVHEN